jgi:hypothetical protein
MAGLLVAKFQEWHFSDAYLDPAGFNAKLNRYQQPARQ